MLGKFSVPGRPTGLADNRARANCACSKCGFVWTFFLSSILSSLFFLPLFGRRPDLY